jgi:predicted component of type VI protein secretion system
VRTDKSFLDKFITKCVYCETQDEYLSSIIKEIASIVSARVKSQDRDSPFGYGIKDLLSFRWSDDEIDSFKKQFANSITKFEPRISHIEVTGIEIKKNEQKLKIKMSCIIPKISRDITQHVKITI